MQFFVKVTKYGLCFNGRWLIFGKVPDPIKQLNDTSFVMVSIRISNTYNNLVEYTGFGKSWLQVQAGKRFFIKGHGLLSFEEAFNKYGTTDIVGRK